MIALRTTLNGKQVCIAGTEDLCVLNSIVNAVGKLGDQSKPKHNSNEAPDLYLSVGGLTGRENVDNEHLRWTEQLALSVGDEIIITVLEVQEADLPSSRMPYKTTTEEEKRYEFEHAKSIYLELKDKFEPTEQS